MFVNEEPVRFNKLLVVMIVNGTLTYHGSGIRVKNREFFAGDSAYYRKCVQQTRRAYELQRSQPQPATPNGKEKKKDRTKSAWF